MTINIKAHENGPIVFEGRLALRDNGHSVPAESSALCRCGQSGKGLFCDGTHANVGFRATGFELQASAEGTGEEEAG